MLSVWALLATKKLMSKWVISALRDSEPLSKQVLEEAGRRSDQVTGRRSDQVTGQDLLIQKS